MWGHVRAASENPLLLVARQEVPQPLDRLGEVLGVGERDHTEVVGVRPVETGALNKQDLFLEEQVEHHLRVVVDVVDLGVEARERVESPHRFDAADAGDGREFFPGRVALLQEASAFAGEPVDGLSPAECHLDGGLPGHVGAQARACQKIESLNKPTRVVLRAGQHHPADSVAGDAVRLGQPVERDAQQVGRERCDGDVLGSVVKDAVVDLVGEDEQIVFARDLRDFFQHVARVDGACRVVRVDDDDSFGFVSDLGADVLHGRHPLVVLIAQVVHRFAAGERGSGRPQRVVGHGDEHLVAVVEQCLGDHGDELGDSVADVHVVHIEVREPGDRLVPRDDSPPCGEDTFRRRVALCVRKCRDHVAHDDVRCVEAENRRVARVELQDPVPVELHFLGGRRHRPTDLVQNIFQLL